MTSSPFVSEKKKADARKAFRVVVAFAVFSFFAAAAGVYFSFFYTPRPSVDFNLLTAATVPQNSLLNPQPPEIVKKDVVEEQTENAALIQEMEEQKKSMEETAESLKQEMAAPAEVAVPAPAAVPEPEPPAAEDPVVETLHQEQAAEIEKQLQKIENLQKEREEIQQKKEEAVVITPAEIKTASTHEDEEKAHQEFAVYAPTAVQPEVKKAKPRLKDFMIPDPSKMLMSSLTKPSPWRNLVLTGNELPPPDLVQTSLVASLPNFSLIMQKPPQSAIPLHIIEPLAELQQEDRYGKLPVKSPTGNSPLKAYSAPQPAPPTVPYIAILLSGLGKRERVTLAAINSIPPFVSLSFSPYSDKLNEYLANARRTGHETFLDLPMQHGTFPEADPGPLGLVSGLPEQENRKRLYRVMGSNVAYIGLAAQRNQNFSYHSGAEARAYVDEIENRGLLMVGGSDEPNMPTFEKTLKPDVYIANMLYRSAIRTRLERALRTAQKQGYAFVRIEAYPVAMVALMEFIHSLTPTAEDPTPKAVFVPVSYHAQQIREKKK